MLCHSVKASTVRAFLVCSLLARCVAPPAGSAAGLTYQVAVEVEGVVVLFDRGVWRYLAPGVTAVYPSLLPAVPPPGTTVTITGTDFGKWQGVVTAGPRTLTCPSWTDTELVCDAPPGVAADVAVVVTASSSLASSSGRASQLQLHYEPPRITFAQLEPGSDGYQGTSPTMGGGILVVNGSGFAHLDASLSLRVAAWLVRGPTLAPPWAPVLPPSPHARVQCTLSSTMPLTATSFACAVPPGSGTGWQRVVVNHDLADPSTPMWRLSLPASDFQLLYHAPTVASALAVANDTSFEAVTPAAAGGFLLLVTGSDFSGSTPDVTVGTLPCRVVGPVPPTHDRVLCEAPPRQVDATSDVVVTVDGQTSGSHQFVYAAPIISSVEPRVLDATPPSPSSTHSGRMVLRGVNFGVQYRPGMPLNHSVTIGHKTCGNVVWQSDSVVSCLPPGGFAVGYHNVTITVGGLVSLAFAIRATCPSGFYGSTGEMCSVCPSGAQCAGGTARPVAAAGFYPVAALTFTACVPVEACAGGVDFSTIANVEGAVALACGRHYRGPACSQCAPGAHRVKGRCVACPSTEWLLFVVFAAVCVVLGAAAVYIRKKRISLAGLSVGVVSICANHT